MQPSDAEEMYAWDFLDQATAVNPMDLPGAVFMLEIVAFLCESFWGVIDQKQQCLTPTEQNSLPNGFQAMPKIFSLFDFSLNNLTGLPFLSY